MGDNELSKTIGVKVSEAKHRRLKRLAHERYTTVSDLVRGKLDELLEEAEEVDELEPLTDGGEDGI